MAIIGPVEAKVITSDKAPRAKEARPKRKRVKKSRITQILIRASRQTGFITVSLVFRWPIWILVRILITLKIMKPFGYVFLVYPGDPSDLDGYCPRWLARSFLYRSKPTIGGDIEKSVGGKGLTVVVPDTIKELSHDKSRCAGIKKRLLRVKSLTGAKSIAIAGRAPGVFARHGIELDKPFVEGTKGTLFCVTETISEVMKKHGLTPGGFKVAVVGVGNIGGSLLDFLKEEGHSAFGVDIAKSKRDDVFLGKDSHLLLKTAKMVIVLTGKGSDFMSYVKHLSPGTIVIDDTHPRIRKRISDFTFYKVAVAMKTENGKIIRFRPRLPGYKAEWIPGCAVEGIFSAATGEFNNTTQLDFNRRAKELGLFALLVN